MPRTSWPPPPNQSSDQQPGHLDQSALHQGKLAHDLRQISLDSRERELSQASDQHQALRKELSLRHQQQESRFLELDGLSQQLLQRRNELDRREWLIAEREAKCAPPPPVL